MPSTITDRLNGLTTSVAAKAPCRVATTANITLSAVQTIDGITLVAKDRVLVKDQTDTTENGIWIVQSGAWTRAPDFDGSFDAVGGSFLISVQGTVNANSYWRVSGEGSIDIGTDAITFESTSGNLTLQDDLASTASAKGAALVGYINDGAAQTVETKLDQIVDTRDFGTKTLTSANFILSEAYRTEGYELDARQAGVVFDWDDTAQTGTNNTAAMQEALDWLESKGGGTLRLPFNISTSGCALGSQVVIPSGVTLAGADPTGSTSGTILVGTGTSGAILRAKTRAASIRNLTVTSSDARWAIATSASMHGVFIGGDDEVGIDLLSKTKIEDVYVLRQPGDGFHMIGSLEHGTLRNMWAVSCKRHGLAWDDGTRASYTNKPSAGPFGVELAFFRALDCGGNALAIGKAGHAQPPRHVRLVSPEALGCGWDTSAREQLEQIALIGGQFTVLNPDCEDQQYANSTLTTTGDSKTSRATPSGGIYFAGLGIKVDGGHYSSLMNTLTLAASTVDVDINLTNAFFATGTYATAQAVGVVIPPGCTGFAKLLSDAAFTKVATAQGIDMNLTLDGEPYVGSGSSVIDVGIFNGNTPSEYTIASGTLTAPALNVIVRGEGAAADALATFRYVSGLNGASGHVLRLHYGGEDITIGNSGNFLFKDGATSLVLDTAYPVATFVYNLSTTKWVEQ